MRWDDSPEAQERRYQEFLSKPVDPAEVEIDEDKLNMQANAIDAITFEGSYRTSPLAQRHFPTMGQVMTGADLYTALYQQDPKTRENPPNPGMAQLLDMLLENEVYKDLHDYTMFDSMLSMAGTVRLRKELEQHEGTRQILENNDAAQAHQDQADNLQDQIDDIENNGGDAPQEMKDQQQQHQQQADHHKQQSQIQAQNPMTQQQVQEALEEAKDQTEACKQAASGWGDEPGVLEKLALDPNLIALLDNEYMRDILNKAGRIERTVAGERADRLLRGYDNVEIEMGNDLSRLTPQDLALLADEETEDLFMLKYCEGTLQLMRREENPYVKGPIIVNVDESGSMHGGKDRWAKALAFAMCSQAYRERREFGIVCFDMDTRTLWNPQEPEEFLRFLSMTSGGGTRFEPPLKDSMNMIEENAIEADIIFLTDGMASVSEGFAATYKKRKEKLKFRTIAVSIGKGKPSPVFKMFADHVHQLDNVRNGTKQANQIVQQIAQEMV